MITLPIHYIEILENGSYQLVVYMNSRGVALFGAKPQFFRLAVVRQECIKLLEESIKHKVTRDLRVIRSTGWELITLNPIL